MRVLIATWGSRGDFQPYLALAAAFRRVGHEVRLAAPPDPQFIELAAAHGVAFVPLGPSAGQELVRKTANQAISADNPSISLRLIIDRLLAPAIGDMYTACAEHARWADVVIAHCVQIVGAVAAEAARRPCVTGTLVPTMIPAASESHSTLKRLWPPARDTSRNTVAHSNNSIWLPFVNEVRRHAGLSSLHDLTKDGLYSSRLNLVAVSPAVFKRPQVWAPQHHMTGYWLLGTPGVWAPPQPVVEFLEADGPVIAVGFGSMTSTDSVALTNIVTQAAHKAGVRAIVEPGMAALGAVEMSPDVLVAGGVPHAWLLPRVAALVHHGGVGTTAAALHTGIPSVVVPHVFDQFFWAERLGKLRVAPAPIPIKALTAATLSDAIRTAAIDASMRARARRIGDVLARERGPEVAVRLVEQFAATGVAVPEDTTMELAEAP
jgi:sterol 3beta-glucosyltransferase